MLKERYDSSGLFVHLGDDLIHFCFCGAEFSLAPGNEFGGSSDLLSQDVYRDRFRLDLFCDSCELSVCFFIGQSRFHHNLFLRLLWR